MRTNLLTDLLIRGFGVLRLFITPLILSTTEYGELGLISALFLYANFADLGLQVHYEVISSMRPEEIKSELRMLLTKLIPRLSLSAGVLAVIVFFEFHSYALSFWSFIYVFTLNIDTLFQIILRQQKIYERLAFSLFLQGLILTLLVGPFAWWLRVTGVIALQSLVPLISLFINFYAIKKYLIPTKVMPLQQDHSAWNSSITFWLLLGQVQMMIWITIDRLFLAKFIPLNDLGLWNLGNMAGSVLLGYANTWGTLKLPIWKKESSKNLFEKKFLLSFLGMYMAGVIGLYFATHLILKKFLPGLGWNIIWLTVTFFISLIFITDAYFRSQIKNAADARSWFMKKCGAQLVGALVITFLFLLGVPAKSSLCLGVLSSCLIISIAYFKRIQKYA
jgi:hypothetical protein